MLALAALVLLGGRGVDGRADGRRDEEHRDRADQRARLPSLVGKSSRVMPRTETITAQIASIAPHTWNAFTARNRIGQSCAVSPTNHGIPPVACRSSGGVVDLMDNIRRAMAAPRGGRPVCLVCGRGARDAGRAAAPARRRVRAPRVRDLRHAPSAHRRRAARLPEPLRVVGASGRPATRTRAGAWGAGSACGPRRGGCGGRMRGWGPSRREPPSPSSPTQASGGSLAAHHTM